MEQMINNNLILRLLNIQEFYAHQYLNNFPNDHQKISELINIKKWQLSLQEMLKSQEEFNMVDKGEGGDESGGGGGGTIRGLRGKNDQRFKKTPTNLRRR